MCNNLDLKQRFQRHFCGEIKAKCPTEVTEQVAGGNKIEIAFTHRCRYRALEFHLPHPRWLWKALKPRQTRLLYSVVVFIVTQIQLLMRVTL